MASAGIKQVAVVTKSELAELAEWERKYAEAKKKLSAAEKELKFHRIALAEKVLGIKSSDDLKLLSPDHVRKLQAKRLEAGDWRLERGAPEFSFTETNHGRHPAWMQLYVAELGETAAEKVRTETDVTYSYCVEVNAT